MPLQVKQGIRARQWSACCNSDNEEVTVTVLTPATCLVGKWNLLVETRLKDDGDAVNVKEYKHKWPVYILFNPWCKGMRCSYMLYSFSV